MLGSDWIPLLRAADHCVIATNRQTMDVTDLSRVREVVGREQPDLVIHTAAHTNCDQGEQQPDLPYKVNLVGTWNIALACGDVGSQLAYVSSCGIFDGQKSSPYTELDTPNPLTQHHKSKVLAEQIVSQQIREHYILRPGWLFGGRADHERNFVAKRHREALASDVLNSVSDRFGSPTYTVDFARAANRLIDARAFGLYHLGNQGACSRYDYVQGCLRALGRNNKLLPVDSEQFPRLAPVPVSEALENYFLRLRGFPPMRDWREAMNEYVSQRLLPELVSAK
jgi:dTDP-4-dehydrorhamnose reductase